MVSKLKKIKILKLAIYSFLVKHEINKSVIIEIAISTFLSKSYIITYLVSFSREKNLAGAIIITLLTISFSFIYDLILYLLIKIYRKRFIREIGIEKYNYYKKFFLKYSGWCVVFYRFIPFSSLPIIGLSSIFLNPLIFILSNLIGALLWGIVTLSFSFFISRSSPL